jgi:aldose 1-epimerase
MRRRYRRRTDPLPTTAQREQFGRLADGRPVDQLTLENRNGMRASVLSYGGIVRSLLVPFEDGGARTDVALGFDSLAEYEADRGYVGPLIGRFANRIAEARFTIDGVEFRLPANDGAHHLHGGPRGFHRALWTAGIGSGEHGEAIELDHRSAAFDEGYPGTLDVRVTLELSENNEWIVSYAARTDAPTHVNLTWHGYLNLGGHDAGDVRDHELTLAASSFTPVDATKIPTGEIRAVARTPFDFRRPRVLRRGDTTDDAQLLIGDGYDHNFVIDRDAARDLSFVARVVEPRTGRWLEVFSTAPGVQLHLGQHLSGRAKGGRRYASHGGFALETQHYPDSPNQPSLPSTLLRPGESFSSRTVYRFGAGAGG